MQKKQPQVLIRRAREEDIDAVMSINMESLPENYWYGFYKYLLHNWGEAFLVADLGGSIVGYSMSRIEETGDPVLLGLKTGLYEERGVFGRLVDALKNMMPQTSRVGHLVSIAVKPQYRGLGIGSGLLSETINVMRDFYRVESIYLEVRVTNHIAIRMYEKFGFVKARVVKGYYRDNEDAYIMVKRLR